MTKKTENKTINRYVKPKNGEMPFNRIDFLKKFIDYTGLLTKDCAEIVGLSSPGITAAFRADDIKVSMAHNIVASQGYVLKIWLLKPDDEAVYNPALRQEPGVQFYGKGKELKHTAFVYVAIKQNGYTVDRLAKQLNTSVSTISWWFQTDDIMFSRVYQLAELFGLTVVISIENTLENRMEREVLLRDKQRKIITEFDTTTAVKY